jgi:hypothetical protein
VVTQTGDARWSELDWAWFPSAELVVDGRNSLAAGSVPERIAYRGIGRTGVGGTDRIEWLKPNRYLEPKNSARGQSDR